jgi:DNA-binding LacI/PurR family transcriptional regulator
MNKDIMAFGAMSSATAAHILDGMEHLMVAGIDCGHLSAIVKPKVDWVSTFGHSKKQACSVIETAI